jgi:sialidase-1
LIQAALAMTLVLTSANAVAVGDPDFTIVYTAAEGDFPVIRTPQLLVTDKGSLLAFAQGRFSDHDQSGGNIIVKRSIDGGATWSPLQIVAQRGKDSLNSICVIQPPGSARVLVIGMTIPAGYESRELKYLSPGLQEYQKRTGHDKNPFIVPGFEGDAIARVYVVHSDDDGQTWSPMRDITAQAKHEPPALWACPGPGIAIQLQRGSHAGRMVVPCNELWLDPDTKTYMTRPYAIYSDDKGETWKRGQLAPPGGRGNGNETQMVELKDGSIMLNSRAVARLVATSKDGGETWSPLRDEPTLVGPGCAAGLIRFGEGSGDHPGPLLYSAPAAENRFRGVVWLSDDDGKTWGKTRVLREGRFKYSGLARLPDGKVGCIFDGVTVPTDHGATSRQQGAVILARFGIDWVKSGGPFVAAPAPAKK